MLLCGCCAVSVLPPVCVWNRSVWARPSRTWNRSRTSDAQSRRAARNFATSSKKSEKTAKKKEQPRRELRRLEARRLGGFHVRDRVGHRKAEFLDGGRSRLPQVDTPR